MSPETRAGAGLKPASARTILLVEDEEIIALAEFRTLARAGYAVLVAHGGERAVELALGEPAIDLVLMDIDLGAGMDGTEAARRILELRDLPLVFLSSHTEPKVVEKTEGITSYGYIVKNSGETVLLASIKMAFRLFAARAELRDREEHYRSLFENAGGPVWIEDFSAFKRRAGELCGSGGFRAWLAENPGELFALADLIGIVDMNRAALASIGAKEGGPLPRTLGPFLGPESRAFLAEELSVLAEGGTAFEAEIRVEREGGEPSTYFLSLKAIPGYEADLSRVHVLMHDLSAARRAELALKESERRNAALLAALPDLMFAFTREGLITDCRTPDPRLLYVPAEEQIGRRVSEILPPALAELTLRKISAVLERGQPEVYGYVLDIGGPRRFESRLVPMGKDACLAIVREIGAGPIVV